MSNYSYNPELNDPRSPYYLGAPSTLETINNYLYGNGNYYGSGYNTNFLGRVNNRFITPLRADQVEIQGRIDERRKREGVFMGILAGVGILGSFLLLRKIPAFVKKIPLIGRLFK